MTNVQKCANLPYTVICVIIDVDSTDDDDDIETSDYDSTTQEDHGMFYRMTLK